MLAGGGYIDGLHRRVGAAVVPIATFVMVTEPLHERLRAAIRVPYAISDITLATNYYCPLHDGRLLWGGRMLAWEPTPMRIGTLLGRDMARVYPALAGVRVEVAWSGLMPYLRHRMPMVGRLNDGVWVATGFGGLGMALSSALALALGASQRTVQRALGSLAAAGKVQSFGRARARRWMTPPMPGFATTLLLPGPMAGGFNP